MIDVAREQWLNIDECCWRIIALHWYLLMDNNDVTLVNVTRESFLQEHNGVTTVFVEGVMGSHWYFMQENNGFIFIVDNVARE